jgi:hypothetical protein
MASYFLFQIEIRVLKKTYFGSILKIIHPSCRFFVFDTFPRFEKKFLSLKKRKRETIRSLRTPNGVVNNSADIVNLLYEQFHSVFEHDDGSALPRLDRRGISCAFSPEDINVQDIKEKLNKNDSPGSDDVHDPVLNECAKILTLPLCIIFKRSLREEKLSRMWKLAYFTPIFKKGSRMETGNYR